MAITFADVWYAFVIFFGSIHALVLLYACFKRNQWLITVLLWSVIGFCSVTGIIGLFVPAVISLSSSLWEYAVFAGVILFMTHSSGILHAIGGWDQTGRLLSIGLSTLLVGILLNYLGLSSLLPLGWAFSYWMVFALSIALVLSGGLLTVFGCMICLATLLDRYYHRPAAPLLEDETWEQRGRLRLTLGVMITIIGVALSLTLPYPSLDYATMLSLNGFTATGVLISWWGIRTLTTTQKDSRLNP